MNSPIMGLRVAGYEMPLWPSVLALVVLGGLAWWMWKLAGTSAK